MEENAAKKILIVDDDPSILELYSEVLISDGFAVKTVQSVDDMLKVLTDEKFDLVLLDIMLGEGVPSGIEGLKMIKQDVAKYHDPIVVMLTNLAVTQNVTEAFKSGASAYLIKLTLSNENIPSQIRGILNGFSKSN